jgi:hypothetical protein
MCAMLEQIRPLPGVNRNQLANLSQFLGRTENGELIDTQEDHRQGDDVRDHPVHLGNRYRPVSQMERNDLADRRWWFLARCLPWRIGCDIH